MIEKKDKNIYDPIIFLKKVYGLNSKKNSQKRRIILIIIILINIPISIHTLTKIKKSIEIEIKVNKNIFFFSIFHILNIENFTENQNQKNDFFESGEIKK